MASKLPVIDEFLSFIHDSPTPYHAVRIMASTLKNFGFTSVNQTESQQQMGKRFYISGGCLIAVAGPENLSWSSFPLVAIAAHTDSPCLKLKPVSKKTNDKGDLISVGVQTYGGGIWHSWFDRDLRMSGLALTKDSGGRLTERLFNSGTVCRIPNIAIHLLRTQNDKLTINKETHMVPIFGIGSSDNSKDSSCPINKTGIDERHDKRVIDYIANEINVPSESIIDIDAMLNDACPPTLAGLNKEFIFAPRLDNLASCFGALKAFLAIDYENTGTVSAVAFFNNEEIGSETDEGAATGRVKRLFSRMGIDLSNPAIADNSFIVSTDVAHAYHPSFSDLYECEHRPTMNGGPVIKTNANGRYTTNLLSGNIIRQAGEKASIPLQEFVVRNDMACGSTIGPILSSRLGLTTVDIGIPILSMHSIREMMASEGMTQFIDLLKELLQSYTLIRGKYNEYWRES